MKPHNPTEFKTTIEKFSHDGRGIARIDGKTTFIQGALPDETVVFQYTRRKKDFDEGVVVSVETASPHRVEPNCPHFKMCGGCALQHLDSSMQIKEKQAQFLDMLARIGHCKPEELLPPLSGPVWHYRHKARLSARYNERSNKAFLGFRERHNPRYIANITTCPILHTKVDAQIEPLRHMIASLRGASDIAQVEVAAGDDDIALIFRNMTPLHEDDQNKLIAYAESTGFRVFLQPGGPDSVKLLYPPDAGDFLTYRLPSEDVTFSFHPMDFTQINTALNRLMVPLALELLDLTSDDIVLDLFCGLGNFSLPIAKHCHRVIGVEGSEMMVKRAQMNAAQNQIANVSFFSANLDDSSIVDVLAAEGANKLLIDPARLGAHEIVKQIEKINPERIVYVSCNPATLARDAGILVNEKGYRMLKAGVMDMFPHTAHVESIALFER